MITAGGGVERAQPRAARSGGVTEGQQRRRLPPAHAAECASVRVCEDVSRCGIVIDEIRARATVHGARRLRLRPPIELPLVVGRELRPTIRDHEGSWRRRCRIADEDACATGAMTDGPDGRDVRGRGRAWKFVDAIMNHGRRRGKVGGSMGCRMGRPFQPHPWGISDRRVESLRLVSFQLRLAAWQLGMPKRTCDDCL